MTLTVPLDTDAVLPDINSYILHPRFPLSLRRLNGNLVKLAGRAQICGAPNASQEDCRQPTDELT